MLRDFITRNRQIQRQEVDGWVPGLGGWGEGDTEWQPVGTGFLWGNKNVLEPDGGGGSTALRGVKCH